MGAFDDLIPGGVPAGRNAGAGTPKQRGDALGDYQRAVQLGEVIGNIEAKFAAGPGRTSGFEGLMDYLPLPQNKAFDTAGNQLRGFIKSTQGMTGGENNTATESRMNIGPFIPESSDYDTVVREKIAALKREQARALQTSVALLGGVPDANGRVTPANPRGMIGRGGGATAAAPKKRLRYNPATGDFE